jgi:hypothetical protein
MSISITGLKMLIAIIIVVAVQGCMALQAAKFSKAYVERTSPNSFDYGDGVGLKLPALCFGVREGMGSADYRYQFAGPLFFTIVPFELFDREVKAEFYELQLDFIPDLENSILFDPKKAILYLDDGSSLQPFAYQVWHYNSASQPFLKLKDLKGGIILKTTSTQIRLRYEKPNDKVQMSKLVINGLHSKYERVGIPPVIMFEPRKTQVRYVFPGTGRDNLPFWFSFRDKCK